MNRRSFITALASAPLLARMPGVGSLAPHAERTYKPAPASGAFGSIQVEVTLAATERHARDIFRREAQDPFDGNVGEFYVDSFSRVDIPEHLPGSVTTFATVVGYAAEKGVVHVGAFRRGAYVWVVRVRGGHVAWALEAAEWITGVELPDEGRVRLAPSLVESLLPAPEDLGDGVRLFGP